MRTLIIFLFSFISLSSYSHDEDKIEQTITHELLVAIYDETTLDKEVKIYNLGTYVLVNTNNVKNYAFTTKKHPGHPGYVKWTIRKENGKAYLDSIGRHGKSGEEFHKFESKVNSLMYNRLKSNLETT